VNRTISPTLRVCLPIALLLASGLLDAQTSATQLLVLYRPSNATFYTKVGSDDKPATELRFGVRNDVPLWADFNGDGAREPAVYRNGEWLISMHGDGKVDKTVNFGGELGDIPLAADIDGDGKADCVIFRNGQWLVRGTRDPSVTLEFYFGTRGDVPVLGDFDGDGKIDLAVFRAGQWYVDTNRDGKAELTFAFGGELNDRPVAAWEGGARAAPALFRAGEWLVSAAHDGKVSAHTNFGAAGDVPLAIWMQK